MQDDKKKAKSLEEVQEAVRIATSGFAQRGARKY